MAELGFRTYDEHGRPRRPARVRRRRRPLEGAGTRPRPHPASSPTCPTATPLPPHADAGPSPLDGALDCDADPRRARRDRPRRPVSGEFARSATSTARSAAMLSGEIARELRPRRAPPETRSRSSSPARPASASAPCSRRASTLTLEGDANDYVGKGLSGGRSPSSRRTDATFVGRGELIAGNTVLLRRDRRRAFFRGLAGERFAVRNSGVDAVVEGIGDHGCEYMTGGRVVVLGRTGPQLRRRHERRHRLRARRRRHASTTRCNMELVGFDEIDETDETRSSSLDLRAPPRTRLPGGRAPARDWEATLQRFVKVMPHDYKRALAELAEPRPRRTRPQSARRRPSARRGGSRTGTGSPRDPLPDRAGAGRPLVGAFARLAPARPRPADALADDGRRRRRLVHRRADRLRGSPTARYAGGFLARADRLDGRSCTSSAAAAAAG